MSSKPLMLRQHTHGNKYANHTPIDLSLDNAVLSFVIRGPNLLGSHVEENFELLKIDQPRDDSGSLAILRQI